MIEVLSPIDHDGAAFGPLETRHCSQNASGNTSPGFRATCFCGSLRESETQKVPRAFYEGLTYTVCCTAKWLKSS